MDIEYMETLEKTSQIEGEMIKSYISQALRTEITGLVTGLIVAYFFWNESISQPLTIWLIILVTGPFIHHFWINQFQKNKINVLQLQITLRIFWFASGCLWGSFSLICLGIADIENFMVLTGLMGGMLAGALPGASRVKSFYMLFAVPLCLLYSYAMFSVSAIDLSVMGVLGFLMLGLMLMLSHQFHEELKQSIRLRFENLELVEELKQSNVDKTRFLAAASHDLRQPHQALGLFIESLDHLESDEKKKGILSKTKQAFVAMSALLDQLLDISKLDANLTKVNMQAVQLQPILHAVVMELIGVADKKGVELRLRPTQAIVWVDVGMFNRILSNLINNAIKYTDRGGILLAVRQRKDTYILDIWDTGRGIPKGKIQYIFKEFTQLENPERDRTKGLGLGLAIVQRLAKLMNIDVTVLSREGKGSRFSLTLNRANKTDVQMISSNQPILASFIANQTVVVIDDDKIVRDGLKTLLSVWGCHVLDFVTAQAYLDDLSHENSDAEMIIPDALIVDYRLQGETTGIDAIDLIQAELQKYVKNKVPALIISGDTSPERIEEVQASGYPMLHKPVSPDKLKYFLLNGINKHDS